MKNPRHRSRRDFLSGRALQKEIRQAGDELADELLQAERIIPEAGNRIRLDKVAMACDFEILLNPDNPEAPTAASEALDLIDSLEDQMTVYRSHSEISELNRRAADEPVEVEPRLYALLRRAAEYSRTTDRAFDLTAGPLIKLWKDCREGHRLPTTDELADRQSRIGMELLQFDDEQRQIRFARPGVELNLGAIGKGYALDRAGEFLAEQNVQEDLLAAGGSSILARGGHNGWPGWPVGLQHPLLPKRQLGTLLLSNRGMSTSGSNVQFFELEGRRYGHLLDPRSGWPAEGLLLATVLAPTAEQAEALSTAFFVLGVEKALEYCHNHTDVAAVLIPQPKRGRTLQPLICGLTEADVYPASPDEPWTFVSP